MIAPMSKIRGSLRILNFLLTSFMTYGVILLIVMFQPELRRALEQLGTSKVTRFFGIDKDIATKTNRAITSVYRLFKRAVLKIGSVMKGQNK